jgi:hypothetical protein
MTEVKVIYIMETLMKTAILFGEPKESRNLEEESVWNTVLWAFSSIRRA